MFQAGKCVPAIFIAIMLLAQIGLAQHSTVHFVSHGTPHYEHSHEEHSHHNHDDKKNAAEDCQICLQAKSLSFALVAADINLSVPAVTVQHRFERYNDQVNYTHFTPYQSRAPPSFLI